jgi:tRNA (adenine37-N6)-methyltransferase
MPENMRRDPFLLTAIGYVETVVPDHAIAAQRRTMVSDIVILPQYLEGLTGIEAYSHLIALFLLDRTEPSADLVGHPRGDSSLPLAGVLAMRGRSHPNPIGLAVVELLSRHANRLTVRRLDAYHGSPIIDLKPYDHYDSYTDIRVPDWFKTRARQ